MTEIMKNSRREFLAKSGGAALAAGLGVTGAFGARERLQDRLSQGSADACIFIWLGGGAAQIDMWDPKNRGDSRNRRAGSDYDSIPTAVSGVRVTEHLGRCANLLDRMVLIKTIHHGIDEHGAAVNRMHTGRPVTATVVYPSIGSVVSHQRGPAGENVPAYVVMGYPNATRGPGFLGSQYGYVYLTETEVGPNGLTRPHGISASRQARRRALLNQVRAQQVQRNRDNRSLAEYAALSQEGFQLAGPDFLRVFNLQEEPSSRRERYGSEFGQRCLLARRLLQSGVRFVEVSYNLNFVNGTGWDTHNEGQRNQHLLIRDLDQAISALIEDLERNQMLDRTLIAIGTEFGRPPEFDGGGGRGHQPTGFTVVLAGGGLRTGRVIGELDDRGKRIARRPVSVPDWHATMYWAMGINPTRNLYTADERPVPITDGGEPIAELFQAGS